MTTTTGGQERPGRKRGELATVWLLTQQGRELAGHADAERAWAHMQASEPCSVPRSSWFSPVEINIGLPDVDRAVAKWERIARIKGVCHVDVHERCPGDRRNEVY